MHVVETNVIGTLLLTQKVAKQGFNAMMKGTGEVITGWHNKLRAAIAHIIPADTLADMHRAMSEPQR